MRILVVDDSPLLEEVLAFLRLELPGAETVRAKSAAEATACLEDARRSHRRIDAVILGVGPRPDYLTGLPATARILLETGHRFWAPPPSLIVHFVYNADPVAKAQYPGVAEETVEKNDGGVARVVGMLKSWWHRRLLRGAEALFRKPGQPHREAKRPDGPAGTLAANALLLDIRRCRGRFSAKDEARMAKCITVTPNGRARRHTAAGAAGSADPEYSERRESPHFEARYNLRSRCANRGVRMEGPVDALDGVPGPGYVLAHLKALEKVRARFVRCGWRVDPGRIPVFFKALEPGLEGRTIGEPLGIELSSRHRDAGRPGDRARIEYVAAHELFHVVQAGFRGESLGQGDPWAWFGEATAQFMVGRGSPRNPHRLEWVSSQFDHPERPLDAPGAEDYGAMLFCKFLEDRFRKGRFLQRVWNLARQCKSPFHAVERLASAQGHGKRIPFASATEEDLFCNEFLAWNFFLDKWPAPGGYRQAWELSRRFQHAFTGPLEIGDDSCAGGGKALPPLGARYHLMRLRSGLAKLKVTLSMKSDRASLSPGKGILRLVSADRRPLGAPQQLILKRGRKGNSRFEGEAVLANGKAGRDAYVLLIVANTDWKKRRFIARYDFSCHAIP